MSIQKVNTEGIAAAAARISAHNNTINQAFARVTAQSNNMACSWNSPAGDAALETFHKLIQGNESRSAVLQNHAATLHQVVAPGYDTTEKHNTKLADLFL